MFIGKLAYYLSRFLLSLLLEAGTKLFKWSPLSKKEFWEKRLKDTSRLLGLLLGWLLGILENRANGGTAETDPPLPPDLEPYFREREVRPTPLRPLAAGVQVVVPTSNSSINLVSTSEMEELATVAGRGIFKRYADTSPPRVFDTFMREAGNNPVVAFRRFSNTYNILLSYFGGTTLSKGSKRLAELVDCLRSMENPEQYGYSEEQVQALDRALRVSTTRFNEAKDELDHLLAIEQEATKFLERYAFAIVASVAEKARKEHVELFSERMIVRPVAAKLRQQLDQLATQVKQADDTHRRFHEMARTMDQGDSDIKATIEEFDSVMGQARGTTNELKLDHWLKRIEQLFQQLQDLKERIAVQLREYFAKLGFDNVKKPSDVPRFKQVRKGWKQALKEAHPDIAGSSPEQTRLAQEINAAFEALKAEYEKGTWKK